MICHLKKQHVGWAAMLMSGLFLLACDAAVVVNVTEQEDNVIFEWEGTVNTNGLVFGSSSGTGFSGVFDSESFLILGAPKGTRFSVYVGLTSTLPVLGPRGGGIASSGFGDLFGYSSMGDDILVLPNAYISGDLIKGGMTFENKTISDLAITPGEYLITWGGGPDADFAKINVIPEPQIVLLTSLPVGLLLARRRSLRCSP